MKCLKRSNSRKTTCKGPAIQHLVRLFFTRKKNQVVRGYEKKLVCFKNCIKHLQLKTVGSYYLFFAPYSTNLCDDRKIKIKTYPLPLKVKWLFPKIVVFSLLLTNKSSYKSCYLYCSENNFVKFIQLNNFIRNLSQCRCIYRNLKVLRN